jgi:hypothetical protein
MIYHLYIGTGGNADAYYILGHAGKGKTTENKDNRYYIAKRYHDIIPD